MPSRLDYQQSDCLTLERDKALKPFYPSFNSTSFENTSLSNCFVAKKRQHSETSMIQPYTTDFEIQRANIFNEDLIAATKEPADEAQHIKFKVGTSASAIQPLQMLGATLRPHNSVKNLSKAPVPMFGLSALPGMQGIKMPELNDPAPFGISLAIPSLPPYEPNPAENAYPKTFFSFEPQAKPEEKTTTNLIDNPSQVRIPSPQTKRDVKKEAKKKSKKSIWNLMPYVDESLLKHNVASESGIARMWEDESVHLSMRNLKVGEPGLITNQKELHTLERYQEATRFAIKVPGWTKTIKQTEFVEKIILLL